MIRSTARQGPVGGIRCQILKVAVQRGTRVSEVAAWIGSHPSNADGRIAVSINGSASTLVKMAIIASLSRLNPRELLVHDGAYWVVAEAWDPTKVGDRYVVWSTSQRGFSG